MNLATANTPKKPMTPARYIRAVRSVIAHYTGYRLGIIDGRVYREDTDGHMCVADYYPMRNSRGVIDVLDRVIRDKYADADTLAWAAWEVQVIPEIGLDRIRPMDWVDRPHLWAAPLLAWFRLAPRPDVYGSSHNPSPVAFFRGWHRGWLTGLHRFPDAEEPDALCDVLLRALRQGDYRVFRFALQHPREAFFVGYWSYGDLKRLSRGGFRLRRAVQQLLRERFSEHGYWEFETWISGAEDEDLQERREALWERLASMLSNWRMNCSMETKKDLVLLNPHAGSYMPIEAKLRRYGFDDATTNPEYAALRERLEETYRQPKVSLDYGMHRVPTATTRAYGAWPITPEEVNGKTTIFMGVSKTVEIVDVKTEFMFADQMSIQRHGKSDMRVFDWWEMQCLDNPDFRVGYWIESQELATTRHERVECGYCGTHLHVSEEEMTAVDAGVAYCKMCIQHPPQYSTADDVYRMRASRLDMRDAELCQRPHPEDVSPEAERAFLQAQHTRLAAASSLGSDDETAKAAYDLLDALEGAIATYRNVVDQLVSKGLLYRHMFFGPPERGGADGDVTPGSIVYGYPADLEKDVHDIIVDKLEQALGEIPSIIRVSIKEDADTETAEELVDAVKEVGKQRADKRENAKANAIGKQGEK